MESIAAFNDKLVKTRTRGIGVFLIIAYQRARAHTVPPKRSNFKTDQMLLVSRWLTPDQRTQRRPHNQLLISARSLTQKLLSSSRSKSRNKTYQVPLNASIALPSYPMVSSLPD